MNNTTIRYQTKVNTYSMEASIDHGNPVRVAPRMAVTAQLQPGPHVVRASIPLNGNELGVAIAEFTIEPGYRYEIQYEPAGIYITSRLTIVRHNGTGGENTVLYATQGSLHPLVVFGLACMGIGAFLTVGILLWILVYFIILL